MEDTNSPYKEGTVVTILENGFTNGSKSFIEWNTQADGNGTAYQPSDSFTMLAENVTLYAQWSSYDGGNTETPPEIDSTGGFDSNNKQPKPQKPINGPQTSDSSAASFWFILSCVSMIGLHLLRQSKKEIQ